MSDRPTGQKEYSMAISNPEELVKTLAGTRGPLYAKKGMLWFEDGESVDLNLLLTPADHFYQCCYEPRSGVDESAEFTGPRFPTLDQAIGYGMAICEFRNGKNYTISVNLYKAVMKYDPNVGEPGLAEFVRHCRIIEVNEGVQVRMPTNEEEPNQS